MTDNGCSIIHRKWDGDGMQGMATFSPCERYRYTLYRRWDRTNPRILPVIMLNPSTATEELLDPTIRRVIGFAKREEFGAILVGNIFAFRATSPMVMRQQDDPIGPENDAVIRNLAMHAKVNRHPILCGWGSHGSFRGRSDEVWDILNQTDVDAECLGQTSEGQPKHPLYIRSDQPFVPWRPRQK